MIISLSIRNFVLIEQIAIELRPTLNIITGVTGGGKSLVLKALDFLLGARASADVVLPGRDQCEVSAVFRVDRPAGKAVEALLGIAPDEEGCLILRRVYRSDRTNLCFVNSTPVLVADLARAGEVLVDYLAQNHQLHLQKPAEQLAILDDFAQGGADLEAYQAAYEAFRKADEALAQGEEARTGLAAELDERELDRREIEALDPQPDEDTGLKNRIAMHENLAALVAAFQRGVENLYEGENAAFDTLHAVRRAVLDTGEVPAELTRIADAADQIGAQVTDLVNDLRSFIDDADGGGESLAELEKRYYALQDVKHRLGMSMVELLAYRAELPGRIAALENAVVGTEELVRRREAGWQAAAAAARKLRKRRQAAGKRFAGKLMPELAGLGMKEAGFEVQLDCPDIVPENAGRTGCDRAEFRFSANPGMELRALKDVASGGELSRIMLAIQCIAPGTGGKPILVFDEIDAEIGGRLGAAIGGRMKHISRTRQVICITHLPQIASYGDCHLKIEKRVKKDHTAVRLVPLEGEDRVQELAHMLGGDGRVDTSTVAEVKRMLEKAQND